MAFKNFADSVYFVVLNGLWTKRKFSATLFLFLVHFSNTAYCDNLSFKDLPVINRCCPLGLEYSVETDQCVTSEALSSVQYESESTTSPRSNIVGVSIHFVSHGEGHRNSSGDEGVEEIRLPSELVIAIPLKQNSPEYSFR